MMFTMVVINLNLYCLAELDLVIQIIEFDCDQFIPVRNEQRGCSAAK